MAGNFLISFSFFFIFSVFLESNVNGVELECSFDIFGQEGCFINNADLSMKTIGASFTFSTTYQEKQRKEAIIFAQIGKVDHLPRNLLEEFPYTKQLAIFASDVPVLRNNFFKPEFSKLRKINFNWNKMRTVEERAFAHLTNLEEIGLFSNEIKSLPAKLFQNNRKLEKIHLERNKIKMIHPDTFKNMNQLKELKLNGNECIDLGIGCYHRGCPIHSSSELQRCYENYKISTNLLNEGENNFVSF
jgi:hypothetical protein